MNDMSKTDQGTEYEKFVQLVYQSVVDAEGVENIDVRHNVRLVGKSGCEHQIDVYWEFRAAGQLFRTAIECKSFNSRVSIGRVRDFHGVLADIPGLTGIFATLFGYQSGAKKFADHYGISLKELREPTTEDWKGRVKTIVLRFHIVEAEIKSVSPRVHPEFLSTLSADGSIEKTVSLSNHDKIIIGPGSGQAYSYEDLRQMLPTGRASEKGLQHVFEMPDHIWRAGELEIPIDGLSIAYDVQVTTETTTIDGAALARAIVKDAVSGELSFVTKSGEVRKPRD